MAKALDFIDPEKLSMTVVLTAMNRFLNETDGTWDAMLDMLDGFYMENAMEIWVNFITSSWFFVWK